METKHINQRLADINSEVKAITKSRRNEGQKFMFRGIDDVMNELHGLFAKNEVIILPEVQEFETENRTSKSGTLQTFTRLRVKYTFIAPDGTSVCSTAIGEAMDTADKGMNKAMSIALKYALLQMFLIPTEETKDPDAFSPEETDALTYLTAKIKEAQDVNTLCSLYAQYSTEVSNNPSIKALFTKRKEEINHAT